MSMNKVTKQHSRFKWETVGALMCNRSWLRKELESNNYIDYYMIRVYIVYLTCIILILDEKRGASQGFD